MVVFPALSKPTMITLCSGKGENIMCKTHTTQKSQEYVWCVLIVRNVEWFCWMFYWCDFAIYIEKELLKITSKTSQFQVNEYASMLKCHHAQRVTSEQKIRKWKTPTQIKKTSYIYNWLQNIIMLNFNCLQFVVISQSFFFLFLLSKSCAISRQRKTQNILFFCWKAIIDYIFRLDWQVILKLVLKGFF